MKTLKMYYLGHSICVPWSAKYLATDADGNVCTFREEPQVRTCGYSTPSIKIAEIQLQGRMCWRETIVVYGPQRSIVYYKRRIYIPHAGVTCITTDANGAVFSYSEQPMLDLDAGGWTSETRRQAVTMGDTVPKELGVWQTSLINIA